MILRWKQMNFFFSLSWAETDPGTTPTHQYKTKVSSDNLADHKEHRHKLIPKILFWVGDPDLLDQVKIKVKLNPETVARKRNQEEKA
jgi:hypothetical protein